MEPTEAIPKRERSKGRPKRADAPKVPWDVVDTLLVHGEQHADPDTGQESVRYPSLRELAKRYGVSQTRVWSFASKRKCFPRRLEAQAKTQIRTDHKVIEKLSDARASATADALQIVNEFLFRFETELREGRVQTNSPSDFDRLTRLRELLRGGADSRTDVGGQISLVAIQERHRSVRVQVDRMSPELAGTAAQAGDAGDAGHEEQAR